MKCDMHAISSNGTRIRCAADSIGLVSRKLLLGVEGYRRTPMLAVRVQKCYARDVPGAAADTVVGLSFRDGDLHVEILNPHIAYAFGAEDRGFFGGTAFCRVTNRYVWLASRLVIGRDALVDGATYEVRAWSNQHGDCLELVQQLPRRMRKRRGSEGSHVLINVTALVAASPLTIRHDSRVFHNEDEELGHFSFVSGGLAPFLAFGTDGTANAYTFLAAGWRQLMAWMEPLAELDGCSRVYWDERGGGPADGLRLFESVFNRLRASRL